jgi:hypothetical protein
MKALKPTSKKGLKKQKIKGDRKMKYLITVFTITLMFAISFVTATDASTFNFNYNNQGWSMAGWYVNDGISDECKLPGWSETNVRWISYNGNGVITLPLPYRNRGPVSVPYIPGYNPCYDNQNDNYARYDINSPALDYDSSWNPYYVSARVSTFTYQINGEHLWISEMNGPQNLEAFVQAVVIAKDSSGGLHYYSDGNFNLVSDGWKKHTVYLSNLSIPSGYRIHKINLRFFFPHYSDAYESYILIDNVTPISRLSYKKFNDLNISPLYQEKTFNFGR